MGETLPERGGEAGEGGVPLDDTLEASILDMSRLIASTFAALAGSVVTKSE